jgi:hypothetical protein
MKSYAIATTNTNIVKQIKDIDIMEEAEILLSEEDIDDIETISMFEQVYKWPKIKYTEQVHIHNS